MAEQKVERITRNELNIISTATSNGHAEGTFVISPVGHIREEDINGLRKSVDLLLQVEGCETVLAFGIADSKRLVGILRTVSSTVEPKNWAQSIFVGIDFESTETDTNNVEFSIGFGFFANCKDKAALWAITKKTVEALFFDKIGRTDQPN